MQNIQKWEYFALGYGWGAFRSGRGEGWIDDQGLGMSDSLNEFGNDGWELVSSFYNPREESIDCIFKRPKNH